MTKYKLKIGDRVRVLEGVKVDDDDEDYAGRVGTCEARVGFAVPPPAWWVRLDGASENLPFDEHELEKL